MLSGLLITALLLQEDADRNRVRFVNFFARRGLRLLPALLLLLVAHGMYSELTNLPRDQEIHTIGAALLHILNWRVALDPAPIAAGMGHLWSLAIEEQFYLLWPAVLFLFLGLRRNVDLVVALVVAAIAIVLLHRALLWEDGVGYVAPSIRTDTRADSLLVGVLLTSLWVRGRTPNRGVAPAAWIAAAVAFRVRGLHESGGGVRLSGWRQAVRRRWLGCRVLELAPRGSSRSD